MYGVANTEPLYVKHKYEKPKESFTEFVYRMQTEYKKELVGEKLDALKQQLSEEYDRMSKEDFIDSLIHLDGDVRPEQKKLTSYMDLYYQEYGIEPRKNRDETSSYPYELFYSDGVSFGPNPYHSEESLLESARIQAHKRDSGKIELDTDYGPPMNSREPHFEKEKCRFCEVNSLPSKNRKRRW